MNEKNLSLLKKIISPSFDDNPLPFDISRLEKIIKEKIPAALKKNAPPNFPELYFDFEYVYSKFYDFLLFNQLIGKKIVALGGGFSSGKSTFLNSFLGTGRILPTDINPSTSVPAYVIYGEAEKAGAVNTFSSKIEMEISDVRAIAHGFGKDEDSAEEFSLGHLLRSIFVATPKQSYSNIAFLDTPGYSKPDTENYSAKTDEKIARSQLNASDYILWFISADSGTISTDDLKFLAELDKSIPKWIIINKADKAPNTNVLNEMKSNVKSATNSAGIKIEDIFTFSRREDTECDRVQLHEVLTQLNERKYESDFAYNFKKLFTACKEHYEQKLYEENLFMSRFNRVLTLAGDDSEITSCLLDLADIIKNNVATLKAEKNNLEVLQQDFMTELKVVSDWVNVKSAEPSDKELFSDKITDSAQILKELTRQSVDSSTAKQIKNFGAIQLNGNINSRRKDYGNALFDTLKQNKF